MILLISLFGWVIEYFKIVIQAVLELLWNVVYILPTIPTSARSDPGTYRCSLCWGLMNLSGTGTSKSGKTIEPLLTRSMRNGVFR